MEDTRFQSKKSKVEASLPDLTEHFVKLNVIHENDNVPEDYQSEITVIDTNDLDKPFTEGVKEPKKW